MIQLEQRFIDRFRRQYDKPVQHRSAEAEMKLIDYPGYGNIRELEHAIEKAVIISEGDTLLPDYFHLPRKINSSVTDEKISTLEDMEKQMIGKAIDQCGGNLSAVALQLGITRQTLYNKMKKFGL